MDVSTYLSKSRFSLESKLMEDVCVYISFDGPDSIHIEVKDQDSESVLGINLTKYQINELILCLRSMSDQLKD